MEIDWSGLLPNNSLSNPCGPRAMEADNGETGTVRSPVATGHFPAMALGTDGIISETKSKTSIQSNSAASETLPPTPDSTKISATGDYRFGRCRCGKVKRAYDST